MINNSSSAVHLEFTNLPLVEAVLRLSFKSPIQLDLQLLLEMAKLLPDYVPAELPTLECPPAMTSFDLDPSKLNGAAFIAPSGLTVTIQSQMLSARWVKGWKAAAVQYPRFTALQKAFWNAYDALRKVLKTEPAVSVVNMAYVNRLPYQEDVLSRYFRPDVQVPVAMPPRRANQVIVAWRESEPPGVDMRFSLQGVTSQKGQKETEGYHLTTVAGVFAGDQDIETTVELVHNKLQVLFNSIISDQAKREWGLKETA